MNGEVKVVVRLSGIKEYKMPLKDLNFNPNVF